MLQVSVFIIIIISVHWWQGALEHFTSIPSSYCNEKPNKNSVIFY